MDHLSADEARRLALRAQGLLGGAAARRRQGVPALLHELGAVQLDTISVLARSHELVPQARLGPVPRKEVEAAYWGYPARAFEYWSHAACVLPIEHWPWFAAKRREMARRYGPGLDPAQARAVRAALAEGPRTATDLGGAKKGGPWWDWSDVKRAAEVLLWTGELVCVERRGWRRVYDLAERAVPAGLQAQDLDDETCLAALVGSNGRQLGVATAADLAQHRNLRQDDVHQALAAGGTGLVPVDVAGWDRPGWADPDALAALAAGEVRGRHRTTLLSPFDSLIWDRKRTERVFGFVHRLEAYVPKPKRVHGYFVMPLLTGGRLAGRVDPAREGRTLVARRLSLLHPRDVGAMAAALTEAAAWVGCDSVALEVVDPPELAAPLRQALGA